MPTTIKDQIRQIVADATFISNEALFNTSIWYAQNDTYILVEKPSIEDDTMNPVEVGLVGCISDADFRLYPDGAWKPEGDIAISDIHASASVSPLFYEELQTVWPGMEKAWSRIKDVLCPGKAVCIDEVNRGGTFTFRHLLFRTFGNRTLPKQTGWQHSVPPKTDGIGHARGKALALLSHGHEVLIDLRGWPATSKEATDALKDAKIQEAYGAMPIPAFDETGHLISPDLYETMLKGALVRVSVTLTCFHHRDRNQYQFVANLQSIHVIRRKVKLLATRSKEDLLTGIFQSGYVHHVVDRSKARG